MTQFLAEWTDETAGKYVESYTLEVNTKPGFALISELDWSDIVESSSNYANYPEELVPEGWTFTGNGLWCENGGISINNKSALVSQVYDLSGYERVTVVVTAKSSMSQSASKFVVSTDAGEQEIVAPGGTPFTSYVAVIDCNEVDHVTIAGKSGFPVFQNIKVYAGENDMLLMHAATAEEGDADYRLITGITGKNYMVTGLSAAGSFYFRVKANYIDGTKSYWSKSRYVVLSSSDDYSRGDVNHDGKLSIADVTEIINYLLSNDSDVFDISADVDANGAVNISDVTALINILLSGV